LLVYISLVNFSAVMFGGCYVVIVVVCLFV